MKILVNGYNLKGKPTGIANVIIGFLNKLSTYKNIHIEVLVNKQIPECITNRFVKNGNLVINKCGLKNSVLWFFISLPYHINKAKTDVLWSPTPILPLFVSKKVKKIISINDFVSVDFKKTMTKNGRLITSFFEPKTIRNADYLWCISDYTKKRLYELYPETVNKKIFTGCAPDDLFVKTNLPEVDLKYAIKKPFLLFVGSLEPRKNLSFLLKVFEQFHKNNDYQLVVVGAKHWGQTYVSEIISQSSYPKNDVIFLDYISEQELISLYNKAACYISTSLNEGFGLPQTEAMKCGCPVVAAYNSAMIEVVDGAGITVKGWNISEWCNAIINALNNRTEIVERQNKKMADYNWESVTSRFVDFIGVEK